MFYDDHETNYFLFFTIDKCIPLRKCFPLIKEMELKELFVGYANMIVNRKTVRII